MLKIILDVKHWHSALASNIDIQHSYSTFAIGNGGRRQRRQPSNTGAPWKYHTQKQGQDIPRKFKRRATSFEGICLTAVILVFAHGWGGSNPVLLTPYSGMAPVCAGPRQFALVSADCVPTESHVAHFQCKKGVEIIFVSSKMTPKPPDVCC